MKISKYILLVAVALAAMASHASTGGSVNCKGLANSGAAQKRAQTVVADVLPKSSVTGQGSGSGRATK